jgi:hypothetical protein
MGEVRNANRILAKKPERKDHLENLRIKGKDNIKKNLIYRMSRLDSAGLW